MSKGESLPVLVLREEEDDEVAGLLAELQFLIMKHPVAAQALFRAFVQEGRRFAETEEGREWKEALSRSELVGRGRLVWDAVSLNALDDKEETILPSVLLDAFTKATASEVLEPLLSRVFAEGVLGGGTDPDSG